jgi:hypothetical protein
LKKFLVDNGVSKTFFDEYVNIGITPYHLRKSKAEHKYAVIVLAWRISDVLAGSNKSVPESVVNRLEKLAQRCKREIGN